MSDAERARNYRRRKKSKLLVEAAKKAAKIPGLSLYEKVLAAEFFLKTDESSSD